MKNTETKDFYHRVLNIDLVEYFASQGIAQIGKNNESIYFESPFGKDQTLLVRPHNNEYYSSHSEKQPWGNIIDFGKEFHQTDMHGFLDTIKRNYAFKNNETRHPLDIEEYDLPFKNKPHILQLSDEVTKLPIIEDVYARNLNHDVAERFISGVIFSDGKQKHSGFAFKNDADGYTLFSKNDVNYVGPMDITKFDRGKDTVAVFNGVDDMLAWHQTIPATQHNNFNLLVLNRPYHFEKARPFMEQHNNIQLHLNHSPVQRGYTEYAKWLDSDRYKDFSQGYKQDFSLSRKQMNQQIKEQRPRRVHRL